MSLTTVAPASNKNNDTLLCRRKTYRAAPHANKMTPSFWDFLAKVLVFTLRLAAVVPIFLFNTYFHQMILSQLCLYYYRFTLGRHWLQRSNMLEQEGYITWSGAFSTLHQNPSDPVMQTVGSDPVQRPQNVHRTQVGILI